ncbi:hypothetical protein [Pseudomonas viridiflava]|uniref:hypothetical protein n=1 Tax=Pseudomonas viridiflava TaxID=33069 RepID=UPI0013D69943|nr:hypothetical protein [Pseudomonas viridiflava]
MAAVKPLFCLLGGPVITSMSLIARLRSFLTPKTMNGDTLRTNLRRRVSPLKQEHGILLLVFFQQKASPLFLQIWQVFTGSRRT